MRADHTPTRPAALLWDFDGTLASSEDSWHVAEHRLAGELGITLTTAQTRSLVGKALVSSVTIILGWAGRTDLDPVVYAARLNEYALEDMRKRGVTFRPGALELLAEARHAGIPCALVSMSYLSVLTNLTATLPVGSFAEIVSGDQITNGKPHPEPYLTAASRLGVQPAHCLALEDSQPGTESAENAGVPALGIPFEQSLAPSALRTIVPTLSGFTLTHAIDAWREMAGV